MKYLTLLVVCLTIATVRGATMTIDLTQPATQPAAVQLGQGTNADPAGRTITADSQSLFLAGKPWVPIAGEFHFTRYPRAEWRDELLKMKAGGITVVSTYVFWIHHEEEQGKFDWSDGKSLRDFLQLCHELDLLAIVRLGPWCHGEVRNGGFPDWVEHTITAHNRSEAPAFLEMVEPLYQQIFEQIKGLQWKDGGPVIAVQLDNECWKLPYLMALKQMAKKCGIDVPLYTMTGWNRVQIPKDELLPFFGGYATGFWGGSLEDYRKFFVFTDIRDDGDLGAQFDSKNLGRSTNIDRFPYVCCEIGGGMMSSYTRRIKIDAGDIAAMALVKLGNGNNMPGYYMYQGGNNPEGKLSYLNEDHPNPMPVKDYDFQAPLGAAGQVRPHFHLLNEQHLFLHDFGQQLARMPARFPKTRPANIKDFTVLRWSIRSDGERGFLFFNNRQPTVPMPDQADVQFELKTTAGPLLVPSKPVTFPSGSYGIWPINLDCDGAVLRYATAQPLGRIVDGKEVCYFFKSLEGIPAEFAFARESVKMIETSGKTEPPYDLQTLLVKDIPPGPIQFVSATTRNDRAVRFILLTPEQASNMYRASFDGKDRVVISNATVLADGGGLRLIRTGDEKLSFSVYPAVKSVTVNGQRVDGTPSLLSTQFEIAGSPPKKIDVTAEQLHPANTSAGELIGTREADWSRAAEWALHIPADAAGKRVILRVKYTADAARLYAGDRFIDDNYFNGDAMDIPLWRIPVEQWPTLRLKVLPFNDHLLARLPDAVRAACSEPKSIPLRNQVSVSLVEETETRIAPAE